MVQRQRQPAIFLPHGGGPWPFLKDEMGPAGVWRELHAYLTGLPLILPSRPSAILCISAHWETLSPAVLTDDRPSLLFDYYGFPAETYQLSYPAPGAPELAAQVRALLTGACVATDEVAGRGFDHAVFIPMMLVYPEADMPILSMSLQRRASVDTHLRIGRALETLRSDGVLIIGSGMSYQNLSDFFSPSADAVSAACDFDAWLTEAVECADIAARDVKLGSWRDAPGAARSHPTAEHLEPLFVVAGAGGADRGRNAFRSEIAGKPVSAFHFG